MTGFAGSTNLLGEIAMTAAYSSGGNWLDELLIYLEENRDFLVDFVHNELPGINISVPEGTFLGWLDCTKSTIPDPAKLFLEQSLVALNEGSWFGPGYDPYTRINFGCQKSILEEALSRIKEILP